MFRRSSELKMPSETFAAQRPYKLKIITRYNKCRFETACCSKTFDAKHTSIYALKITSIVEDKSW